MISYIFYAIFIIGAIVLAFITGAIWACGWKDDELYPEEDRTSVRADEALRTAVRKRDTCKNYDTDCTEDKCPLCIWYEVEE